MEPWSRTRSTPACWGCRSTCCRGTRWAATATAADPTPSVFARFAEYRRWPRWPAARDAVFQAIPNLQTRWSIGPLLDLSRPPSGRRAAHLAPDADGRQARHGRLPGDGQRREPVQPPTRRQRPLPGAADAVRPLHRRHREPGVRGVRRRHRGAAPRGPRRPAVRCMGAPVYRETFHKQWKNKVASRAYHRDLSEARIVSCPDPTLDGQDLRRGGGRSGGSTRSTRSSISRSRTATTCAGTAWSPTGTPIISSGSSPAPPR